MKCACPYSGMQWKAEGFATGHHALIHPHPVFSLPFKYLISRYTADWYAGRLSEEEKKLLFLAMLKETDLVIFDSFAYPELSTVEQNIESLAKLSTWLHGLSNPAVLLPSFHISKETASLQLMPHWLQTWWNIKADFESGLKRQIKLAEQHRLESFLETKIKRIEAGIQQESTGYLRILAEWADIAACFPSFAISHPITGETIKLADYWKEMLQAPESRYYSYPLTDWKELEDHIIDNIDDLSTTFALAIIRKTKAIINRTSLDLGLEVVESILFDKNGVETGKSYEVRELIEAKEQETIAALAAKAPSEEPQRQNYASQVAFLRAKIAWNFAVKQSQQQAASSQDQQKEI